MITRKSWEPAPVFNAADPASGGLAAAAAVAGAGAPDPAAGASGAADPAAGAAAGAADPAAAAASAGAAPDFATFVQAFPEALRGKDERETLAKVADHLKASAPPASADAYKYDVPADLAGVIDPKTDKVLPIFNKVAHGLQLTQKQYEGVITNLYTEMGKAGLIEAPVDLNAEFRALSSGKGDPAAQIAEGQRFSIELAGSIKALADRGHLDKDLAAELAGPALYSSKVTKGIAALVKLASANGGGIINNGDPPGGQQQQVDVEQASLTRLYPTMKSSAA